MPVKPSTKVVFQTPGGFTAIDSVGVRDGDNEGVKEGEKVVGDSDGLDVGFCVVGDTLGVKEGVCVGVHVGVVVI